MTEFEIQLRDVMLYASHGVMPEENWLGNQYRVNVRLRMAADDFDWNVDDLSGTVSYAEVFDVLTDVMSRPRRLLESVASEFGYICRRKWNCVRSGEIEIVKMVPPIPGMIGQAGVKYIF